MITAIESALLIGAIVGLLAWGCAVSCRDYFRHIRGDDEEDDGGD